MAPCSPGFLDLWLVVYIVIVKGNGTQDICCKHCLIEYWILMFVLAPCFLPNHCCNWSIGRRWVGLYILLFPDLLCLYLSVLLPLICVTILKLITFLNLFSQVFVNSTVLKRFGQSYQWFVDGFWLFCSILILLDTQQLLILLIIIHYSSALNKILVCRGKLWSALNSISLFNIYLSPLGHLMIRRFMYTQNLVNTLMLIFSPHVFLR